MKKKKETKKNYYQEINKALLSYEENKPYHVLSTEWICNRIDWCWKFRHITHEQMEELCDRVCEVLDKQTNLIKMGIL